MARDFHLSNFLPYLLNQAAEQASQKFAAVYRAEYGLQRTDWRVLAHLGEFGKLSTHPGIEAPLIETPHKTPLLTIERPSK